MPTGQNYATNVPQTTLTGLINPTATVASVFSSSGWPAVPFTAILDIGTSSQEAVDVTNITGTTWTIVRGIDSTIGMTHGVGATVTHGDIGRDFREARAHIDASTSSDTAGHPVHGLGGGSSVVGTTDLQSLSNKTLVSPTISGTPAMGSGSWTGTGSLQEATLAFSGLSGAQTQTIRLAGSHGSGPPTTGTFQLGDVVVDAQFPTSWYCISSGTPGTWIPLSGRVLIDSRVLSSSGSSVTFSAIPSYFHSLQLVISAKSDGGTVAGYDSANLQLNNVTSANYNWNSIYATQGGAAATASGAAQTSAQFAEVWNSHFATAGRGITITDFPNYADANNAKIFTSVSSATDGGASGILQTYTGALNSATSTAAISSIKILMSTGNFIADSTFYLYGIW